MRCKTLPRHWTLFYQKISTENYSESLNIENDGKMRTEAVENTNSLRENTEIEIFKRISQTWVIANLRVAQKYHRLESHLKPLTRTNFGQCSFTNDKTI